MVKPAKPEELANAILKLIDNYEMAKELGARAKVRAQKEFTIEKMVSETIKEYQ